MAACNFLVGATPTNEEIYRDLFQMKSTLLVGGCGSGKSVFLHNVIRALLKNTAPKEAKMLLFDPKQVEFYEYGNRAHLYAPVVENLPEAIAALQELVGKKQETPLFLVIDELLSFAFDKKYCAALKKLLTEAEENNLHIFAAMQVPDKAVLKKLKPFFPNLIALRLYKEDAAILERPEAEKLKGHGDMLFYEEGRPSLHLQAPYIK